MEMSESIAEFARAMASVQAEIGGAVKGKTNPAFKSKYADLSAVWDTWQAIGPAAGFSIMQFPGDFDPEARTMGMDQIVTHSSGQWMRSHLSVPLTKTDAQGYGSACTYARRYSLAAAVGICPEDDDGNAASRGNNAPADPVIDDGQWAMLVQLVQAAGVGADTVCKAASVGSLRELPQSKFDSVVRKLNATIAKQNMQEAAE